MRTTRRRFLETGTGLAGSLLILPRGLRGQGGILPNSRLQLALVGVGGRGMAALSALQGEQIVAFCDVDHDRARANPTDGTKIRSVFQRFGGTRWFHDYRVMFEQMADQIDAVVVSVPDHMHYAIGMAALRHRKHLYVEKPLCRCITEVRALHAAARQAGVVTQMGNQGRSADGIRLAREWVQAGLIGDVHTVHAWNSSPSRSYSHEAPPEGTETPPSSLRYDLWLGVAPERPYRKVRSHGSWRGFPEYGTGRIGDWVCHQVDAAKYALDLGAPLSVEAASTEPRPDTFPSLNTVTWRFAARGPRPPVEVKWFDGGLLPPEPAPGFKFGSAGGSIFYGTKGIMHVGSHSSSARLVPEAEMTARRGSLPPKTLPRVTGGPHLEWVNAIRQGRRCGSDFDYSAPLAEIALLGLAAIRARTRLEWDASRGRVTNHEWANQFIGPGYDYRPGWGV
ncbi:MAG: Gfo/Idh/MocA family oxidoreductase [Verrucomicrobia bacterium]|nr:Gfo/Idh/MocA family oxidoreductase [Verrucomicrobiota bacterium]